MALKIDRVDTWAATLKDQPGGLASKLASLAEADVNLEFIISRRSPEKKGKGVAFVTPIKGAAQCRAAKKAGFKKSARLHTLRIEGPDRKGMGATITAALAEADINLRGFSAAAIGRKFVCHVAVDSSAIATAARKALKKI